MPARPRLASAVLPRRHRRALTAVAATVAMVVGAGPALAAPPTPGNLPRGIEPLASYVGQTTCDPTAKPGATALRSLLLSAYRGTGDSGIVRDCSIGGTSEHKEGRAWDWRVNAFDPAQDAAARDFFDWLLAPDAAGNSHAMARRLGVMYIIYNRSIWSSYNASAGWRPYSGSNPHTDHVHISLAWPGANKQTSYWTGAVAPPSLFTPSPTPTTSPTPRPTTTTSPTPRPTTSPTGDPIVALWRSLGGGSGELGEPVGSPYAVRNGRAQDYQRGRILWSSSTGARALRKDVVTRYDAAGGAAGPLGLPTADETAAGSGRAVRFQGGRIYWSGTTGARVVWGAIADAYVAAGGASGALGLPVKDETAVGGAVVQDFERGTVLWSAGTGAHALAGSVAAKFREKGGATGALGLPTSGQKAVAGGTMTTFQGGRIFTSSAGTVALWGDVAKKHAALSGPDGPLGLPTAEEKAVGGGVGVPFTRGYVGWTPATGARATWGGIAERYLSAGGPNGPLGLPTTDEGDVPGGRQSVFQGGRVLWSAGTGAHAVYGGIAEAYAAAGGPGGALGLPTTEESDAPGGGRFSAFQRGRVYWSPGTGAHPVWGGILERYLAVGGPERAGYPVAGEKRVADGSMSRFERGRIYWSAPTGARFTFGGTGERYAAADPAVVGFPTAEETDSARGRVLPLQKGAVHWSATTGARLVAGAEHAFHVRHGGVGGPLGLPVTDATVVAPGVQRQVFAGGLVVTSGAGTFGVRGGILERYSELGGPTGRLGAPTSDEHGVPGGARQDFVGGSLTWSSVNGAVTLS